MFLSIYDLSGIQSFLFSSNKVREISGASAIVHDALFSLLPKLFGVGEEDWKTEERISFSGKDREKIVYIGGGNALVLYDTEETYREQTRELQKQIFTISGGGIRLCSACISLDETASLAENQKNLMRKLDSVKKHGGNALPMPCLPVTAYNNADYTPLVRVGNGVFSSSVQYAKQTAIHMTSAFKSLCPAYLTFVQDMEMTRNDDGKNYQAVIHIDGNTMGIRIREFVNHLADDGGDIFSQMTRMRNLSVHISELYRNAIKKTLMALYPQKETPYPVPFRPIVADGDDVTFLIAASDAFPFVNTFMSFLEKEKTAEFGDAFRPTAAAGIAFVGLKFPFAVAYDIAEALCKNAKSVTVERCGGAEAFYASPVSSFDYQFCMSNIPESIRQYRSENGTFQKDGTDYTVFCRPYLFQSDSPYDAQKFFDLCHTLQTAVKENGIARSKLKGLRNAYGIGVGEAERYCNYLVAHAKTSAEIRIADQFKEPYTNNREAKFFDALDIMDIAWEGDSVS